MNITPKSPLAKLPIAHIVRTIRQHIQPLTKMLPDQRMVRVVEVMLLGILAGQTPVITRMARQNSKEDGESWTTARRIYRLLANGRPKTRVIYEGLYKIGQQVVEQEQPEYLVVAGYPVRFVGDAGLDDQKVYTDWRLRTRIEHGYRFDQEQGLDVEDMRVQTLERMRRLFAFVLLAAQIVFVIGEHWPPQGSPVAASVGWKTRIIFGSGWPILPLAGNCRCYYHRCDFIPRFFTSLPF